ncbi:hypothetical protein [Rheinheimera maricola]|uniref:Response regulatory domain-containing protein n=1 Tax=Rheinheimera maricola TaxID=2793282 RepID=A0ABS7X6C0_9GAMM|nr:hypothetical protein [Rheinheimera maricola]MBZ9611096.1 hypothetical protein [Rheinheimera maricola]
MIFQASFYKTKKILLLEDCEPVRASIKGMLQQIGFEDITAVPDAAQAMSFAAKQSFDFVLADFELGVGKDALQFFTDLTQQALLKASCCFVLLSAEPRRLPVFGLLHGTPDSFLLKPFSYVELEKRLAKVWSQRSKMRKVYQALHQQDLKTAQYELDQIVNAVNSTSLLALRLMAEVLFAQGSYAAASKLYDQVMQQRDFSWARLGQAVAMLQLADYQEAETRLVALTELDEVRPEALEWLACVYLRQGQYELAQKQLTDLLRGQSSHVVAHLASVAVLQLIPQTGECVKYLQKLIQQYRFSGFDRPEYYFTLCRIQLEQAQQASLKEFPAAVKKAQESLSAMPQKLMNASTETPLQALRARISLLQGNIADAKQALSVIESGNTTTDTGAMLDLAKLAFALGEQKQADSYLKQLKDAAVAGIDLLSCCQRLVTLALLQQEQKLRGQIRDWNQAGMSEAEASNTKKALALLRQAFVYMPCNPGLILNLLQVLAQLPADKALKALAKTALTALEFCSLTAANKQRLQQIVAALPEVYLE